MYWVPPGLSFRNPESTHIHQLCLLFQKSIGEQLQLFLQAHQTHLVPGPKPNWSLRLETLPRFWSLTGKEWHIQFRPTHKASILNNNGSVLVSVKDSMGLTMLSNETTWSLNKEIPVYLYYIVSLRLSLLVDSVLVSGNRRGAHYPEFRIKDILPKGSLSAQYKDLLIALRFKEGRENETSRLLYTVFLAIFIRACLIERN